MPPAARVGDLTDHLKTPLGPGPGSSNVKIGGQPAWRVGLDTHSCPDSDGNKPHVAGAVARGSSRVFINKSAAVRKGDEIVEIGPTNSIKTGCDRVLIGD
jgi:uncharacterized Zn-binding protein involved in type VI secretion